MTEANSSARLQVASSPHIVAKQGVTNIMLWVVAALAPAAIWAVVQMDFVNRAAGEPFLAIPL
ncbi:MAG: hypothetical protein PF636_05305, partial [Actinomycetota bacterium]|nr:hypothetical protein [Actinomycetota bacterium]